MYIELNEAQVIYAANNQTVLNYIERCLNQDGSLCAQYGHENALISSLDMEHFISNKSIFYVHENEYEELPAEMRALSSSEPKASLPDYSHLVAFDEHDQEHYFGQEDNDTTLIINHIVVNENGEEADKGVEIQRDSLEKAKQKGFKILIEKEMKHAHRPKPDQTPTSNGEPDYKALALLLIDLYEEKREIDSKIAAIKSQLQ